jgi:hypothetical protein
MIRREHGGSDAAFDDPLIGADAPSVQAITATGEPSMQCRRNRQGDEHGDHHQR